MCMPCTPVPAPRPPQTTKCALGWPNGGRNQWFLSAQLPESSTKGQSGLKPPK